MDRPAFALDLLKPASALPGSALSIPAPEPEQPVIPRNFGVGTPYSSSSQRQLHANLW